MSELQTRFNKAVELVQKQPADGPFQPSVQDKLVFYSLYKQATEGPCSAKKPSMFNPVAKAKWDAWSQLGNMSKEQAMQKYIENLLSIVNKTPASPFKEEVQKAMAPRRTATVQNAGNSQGTKGKVVIYGDLLSQPVRAVLWFCLINNINHEFRAVSLKKGDHLKPEFAKLNPHKRVPCIDDSGFIVYESHAIMRYLAARYKTTDQWFPHNLSSRTRVEQYLDWHHSNLRKGAAPTAFKAFTAASGIEVPQHVFDQAEKDLEASLQAIETIWLKNSDFLAGTSKPSIADLSAYEEISQLSLVQYDLSKYPKILRWTKAMEALPHYAKVHEVLGKVGKVLQQKKSEAEQSAPQAKL